MNLHTQSELQIQKPTETININYMSTTKKAKKDETASAAPKAKGNPDALKEARERMAQNDRFTYLGQVKEGSKKLPPQAQCIVNILEAAGKKGLSRKELGQEMKTVVATRQPIGRILSYYQKMLVERGYVTLVKSNEEASAE